jgi:hypothetical protein
MKPNQPPLSSSISIHAFILVLALHKQLAAAKIEHEKTSLQRQIEATDRQIDTLVYELYELTEEEIRIVEGRE